MKPGLLIRSVSRDRHFAFALLALGVACAAAAYEVRPREHPVGDPRWLRAAEPAGVSESEGAPAAGVIETLRPSSSLATRMMIPRIGVDAPLVDIGVTPDGYMDTPRGPAPVGWYEYGARPGGGSNSIFTGHVDYLRYGPAVFWNLGKLRIGDAISVTLADGGAIDYRVTAVDSVAVEALDMAAVLAPTSIETVTLITCGGAFSSGEYDHRTIVRAVQSGSRAAG